MAINPKTGEGVVKGLRIHAYANLRGADLQGADLMGANLDGANLRGANLEGADLRGASLKSAVLERAKLRDANLEGANLYQALLVQADLSHANFRRAYLLCANLRNATLYETDFGGATLAFMIMPDGTSYNPNDHGRYPLTEDTSQPSGSPLLGAFLEKINFPFGAEGLASAPEELILSRIAEVEALALRLSGMPKQATPGDTVARVLDRKPELTGPIMDEVVSMLDALGEE